MTMDITKVLLDILLIKVTNCFYVSLQQRQYFHRTGESYNQFGPSLLRKGKANRRNNRRGGGNNNNNLADDDEDDEPNLF